MGNSNVTFDSDGQYLSELGGRSYMAAISPWFLTVSIELISFLYCLLKSPHLSTMGPTPTTRTLSTAGTTGYFLTVGSSSFKIAPPWISFRSLRGTTTVKATMLVLLQERNRTRKHGQTGSIIRVGRLPGIILIFTEKVFPGWLDLNQWYIGAFKSGQYPSVSKDRLFLWSRLYPAEANAPADRVGPPTNRQFVSVRFIYCYIPCHRSIIRHKTTSGLWSF